MSAVSTDCALSVSYTLCCLGRLHMSAVSTDCVLTR